ncbi:MAG TPA: hypothetical protein VFK28_12760 [Sphingomicrobium sp.]|jgi:hypothetical protein|nr:hypothetical protein [Sphingomicrobium sp.]
MSRTLFLSMKEGDIVARCIKEKVGVSAVERLPNGGVRLVCMSSDGAQHIRTVLKSKLIDHEVERARHRPKGPMW